MKISLFFIVSFTFCTLYGQDTTYFTSKRVKVSSETDAHFYEVKYVDSNDSAKVTIFGFYTSGGEKDERHYSDYTKLQLHGNRKEWYENGQIKKDIMYEYGKLKGHVNTFWENGQKKREDIYQYGRLLEGNTWDKEGKKTKHSAFFVLPSYKGGTDKLTKFIEKNTKYPKSAKKNKIEGTVIVYFVVEKDGRISSVSIKQSVNEEIDAEALRIVSKMPRWNNGSEDGEPIRVSFNMPLRFKLR